MIDKKTPLLTQDFAELIGKITPIDKPLLSADFGHTRKTRQKIRQEAQLARQIEHYLPQKIDENFENIDAELYEKMAQEKQYFHSVFDLHGLFVREAQNKILDALHSRSNRHLEFWLIVHGKGNNSSRYDRAPIKFAIIQLLRRHPAIAALRARHDSDHKSGALVIAVKPCF